MKIDRAFLIERLCFFAKKIAVWDVKSKKGNDKCRFRPDFSGNIQETYDLTWI